MSLTPILGKRFKKISSNRLKAHLEYINFDKKQHAYLNKRSSTHALLKLTETVKRAILNGKAAGVVFFDFTDAFGNVNRQKLIDKIWNKFKIRGKLFLHLFDFLNERTARLRVNDITGEWKDSDIGTSAGTVLGALLFIMQVFDSPECIDPKFADDFSSIAIADNVKEVERKLQEAVNQLADWADENDMILNELKIKVMLFGKDVKGNELTIEVNNKVIEQKLLFTYLGVLLDTYLSFTKHIESIASKAMKSMNKISGLFRGRRGISVSIGLELHVSLVRPHLEHAAPVWAGITGD